MSLKIGAVEPTQIVVDYPDQSFSVSTESGRLNITKTAETNVEGAVNYYYVGSTSVTYTYSHSSLKLEDVVLDSSFKTILQTGGFTYSANYVSGTLTISITYRNATTSSSPASSTVRMFSHSFTAVPCVEITRLKANGTGVWGKAYTLSVSAGSNVSISCSRESSAYQHAPTGSLANGATIYDGDRVTLVAAPATGYMVSNFLYNNNSVGKTTVSYEVTRDMSLSATAKKILKAAIISGTVEYSQTGSMGEWTANVKITNGNPYTCEINYELYRYDGTLVLTKGFYSIAAGASTNISSTWSDNGYREWGGCKCTVSLRTPYLYPNGSAYYIEFASNTWNDYTEPEETTTTTTTTE